MSEPRQSRRRRQGRAKRDANQLAQPPWRAVRNPFKPVDLLSEEQVERIHQASLAVLRDMGVEFMSDEALDVLERAGADVDRDTQIVRFDPDLVLESIAKAPAEFDVEPRNPERSFHVGGDHMVFTLVSSAPNINDIDNGRRPGTYEDQCNLIRLEQSLNVIQSAAITPVEALDMPVHSRHLDLIYAYLTLSDRSFSARAIGRQRIVDAIEMAAIATGIDRDEFAAKPRLMTNVNVNSPRRMDAELLLGAMEMMDHVQPVAVTPFTLAGAMSPVTLAGSLTQQNAEALAVLAFMQIYRPGTPVIYGGFTSNVDMKSGAPAFGTPEYVKATIAGGQLARRYRLPYRASNVNAANSVDAQAAYESMMSLWACMMGGVNLVWHGAGWLEGGLASSYEKVILDADMIGMMVEIMSPLLVDDDTLALEAIEDVGVAGHFFGTEHTIARYESAFFVPLLSDWRNFENWTDGGSPNATQHANRIWKQLLDEYQQPAMPTDRLEQLDAYMTRRKREIGQGSW